MTSAHPGPYVDTAITFRGPFTPVVITPTPAKSGSTTLGGIVVYDKSGTVKTGFSHTDKAASPPLAWRRGRDPYANNGMVGQDFFKHA